MSRSSMGRDVYFEKFVKTAPDAESYITALTLSPFKTHRRMAVVLLPELELLKDKG